MRKQTSLYIPTPCHEDWNKMTPTQQGKFCASCSKQVVDFSLMSDRQILDFLSNQSSKLCGRFDAEQLQRPLVEPKIRKKKSWWMALTMPLLFLFEKSEARENALPQIDTTISPVEPRQEIMGKLIYHPTNEITVIGKVVDEKNDPVSYATIIQKGTLNETIADSAGNFSIQIKSDESMVTVVASSVGFESMEMQIQVKKSDTVNITMKLSEYVSGDMVVVVVGSMRSYRSVEPIDTIKTAVRKIFNVSSFKIYPNPAIKGGNIHLEIPRLPAGRKQAGEYQLQLFDNHSRLIKAEEINTTSENSASLFTIPSNITAGIYYLRLIDEKKKKQYTEKLIIQ